MFKSILKCASTKKDDLLPTYEEHCNNVNVGRPIEIPQENYEENSPLEGTNRFGGSIDLLETCKNVQKSDLEVPENQNDFEVLVKNEMGHKYSSPLSGRHKSKISLTWVLREQSELKKYSAQDARLYHEDYRASRARSGISVDRYQRHNQKFDEHLEVDKPRHRQFENIAEKAKSCRVEGRNAFYNEKYKFSVRDKSVGKYENPKELDRFKERHVESGDRDRSRSQKRLRHKKRKSRNGGERDLYNFGYEIKDVDCFLSEATIDNPGNIPVVLAYPSVMYQTHSGNQRELQLPLGMVVNAVFKNQQWLYVQTPHGEEGYIIYAACLPMGILPSINRSNSWHTTPCWESSTDIYPRPCGNMTDSEKEQLRGGSRSECGRRARSVHLSKTQALSVCGEQTFDKLYLKAKSITHKSPEYSEYSEGNSSLDGMFKELNISKEKVRHKTVNRKPSKNTKTIIRHTLMVVNSNYEGSSVAKTLTVKKGDVVILIQGAGAEADVDAEWFYVRRRDGCEGFIPAVIAGHGYL